MTNSLTLVGQPSAVVNSKHHDYKQKVQKRKGLPEKSFTDEQFEGFRQKKHF